MDKHIYMYMHTTNSAQLQRTDAVSVRASVRVHACRRAGGRMHHTPKTLSLAPLPPNAPGNGGGFSPG